MSSFEAEAELDRLASGVMVLKKFISTLLARELVEEAVARENWVASASAVYEENKIVQTEYLTKSGVLTSPNFIPNSWNITQHYPTMKSVIMSEWNIPLATFSRVGIARYPKGSLVDEHQDTGPSNTLRLVTFVLYLNDNFRGGDLVFPKLRIGYTPSAGDLIAFLSEHHHRVEEIIDGERFCMIWFGEAIR